MKNLLKTLDKKMKKTLIIIGAMLLLLGYPVRVGASQPQEELDTMTLIEMLNSVDTGGKSDLIQKFQEKEARAKLSPKFDTQEAKKEGFRLETTRNKEVLIVTIPASVLFAPNAIDLTSRAAEYLAPFKRYMDKSDTYRVLLVMHTDNTGSPEYQEQITGDRVDAVFEWFDKQGVDTSYVFPYAYGSVVPLADNDSQENRNKNRRLEIYLMPGEKMVEMAKKGKIEF